MLFNYVLIPRYGIYGAAIATLLGQMAANFIYDFFDKSLWFQLKMKLKAIFPVYLIRVSN